MCFVTDPLIPLILSDSYNASKAMNVSTLAYLAS